MNKVEIYLIGLLAVLFTFSCTDLANNSDDELKSLEDLESSVRLNIHFAFSFDNNTYVADGISVKIGNDFYTTRGLGEIVIDTLLLRNGTYEINVDSEYFEPFAAQIEVSKDTSISKVFELEPVYKMLFSLHLGNSWVYSYRSSLDNYFEANERRGIHYLEIINHRKEGENNFYTYQILKFDTSSVFNYETRESKDNDTTSVQYSVEVQESNSKITVDPESLVNNLEYPFLFLKNEIRLFYHQNTARNSTLDLREKYPSFLIQENKTSFKVPYKFGYADLKIKENVGIIDFDLLTSKNSVFYELIDFKLNN